MNSPVRPHENYEFVSHAEKRIMIVTTLATQQGDSEGRENYLKQKKGKDKLVIDQSCGHLGKERRFTGPQ